MKLHPIFRVARLTLWLTWVFAAVAWLPQNAEATLIQEIFCKDDLCGGPDLKLGEIAFPTETGNSATDVGFAFDLLGFVFTEADITSISWELDPSDWQVLSFSLRAFTGDALCPNDPIPCANAELFMGDTIFYGFSWKCHVNPFDSNYACGTGDSFPAEFEFRHAVPEPPTLWVIMLGLLALAAAVRWNRWPRPTGGSLDTAK